MTIPNHVPGLRVYSVLLAAYAVIWIALEGHLVRVSVLAIALALWLLAAVFRRWLAGRHLTLPQWIGVCGALGAITGFISAVLTLLLMAVKTGLHAHGPEFSPSQIAWVIGQVPWWTSAALMAGLGLAMIAAAFSRR